MSIVKFEALGRDLKRDNPAWHSFTDAQVGLASLFADSILSGEIANRVNTRPSFFVGTRTELSRKQNEYIGAELALAVREKLLPIEAAYAEVTAVIQQELALRKLAHEFQTQWRELERQEEMKEAEHKLTLALKSFEAFAYSQGFDPATYIQMSKFRAEEETKVWVHRQIQEIAEEMFERKMTFEYELKRKAGEQIREWNSSTKSS